MRKAAAKINTLEIEDLVRGHFGRNNTWDK